MYAAQAARKPASQEDLDAFVHTTRLLLEAGATATDVYVLEERPDGSVAVTDAGRYTTDLLDTVAALVALLLPNLSFAGMGWSESDDFDTDSYDAAVQRPYLRGIDHVAPSAHARIAARHALDHRVAAAGPRAVALWGYLLQRG
jgi:hypothetical protein